MKIGIDAQPLLSRSAGVTSYTRGILEEIIRQDKNNQYDLMFFQPFFKKLSPIFKKSGNFRYKSEGLLPYKVFYKLHKWGVKIPLEILFGKHDLWFFPNFVVYPHRTGKSVVVVHDLAFEKVPQYVQDQNVRFLKKFVPRSLSKADHIVVTSEFTKAQFRPIGLCRSSRNAGQCGRRGIYRGRGRAPARRAWLRSRAGSNPRGRAIRARS